MHCPRTVGAQRIAKAFLGRILLPKNAAPYRDCREVGRLFITTDIAAGGAQRIAPVYCRSVFICLSWAG